MSPPLSKRPAATARPAVPSPPSALFLAVLLAGVVLAVPGPVGDAETPTARAPVPSSATGTFELAPCNRTYRMRGTELAPVSQGGLTIALASPENHLTLIRHRLELTPRDDGTHDARFVAELSGSGDLVADVTAGGLTSRLEDRVEVPRQERTVDARVRLVRVPREAGGAEYEMTTVELPEHVVLDVDSQLANRFATLCDTLSLVPGMGFDCTLLRAALSRARVPMPEPGETYLLPPECLTPELRGRLDAYLEHSAAGS